MAGIEHSFHPDTCQRADSRTASQVDDARPAGRCKVVPRGHGRTFTGRQLDEPRVALSRGGA